MLTIKERQSAIRTIGGCSSERTTGFVEDAGLQPGAALSAKVDALERSPAPAAKGTVGESTAKAPHRAPPPPVAITPEPAPGSPTPRDQ
jgi:hypothetical protein